MGIFVWVRLERQQNDTNPTWGLLEDQYLLKVLRRGTQHFAGTKNVTNASAKQGV